MRKLLLIFILIFMAGCTTTSEYNPAKPSYAIMGLGGSSFGHGLKSLSSKVGAKVYTRHAGNRIYNDIIKRSEAGILHRPLIIIGHSLGGTAAAKLSRRLAAEGIKIDYLAIIDAPKSPVVSRVPRFVDNFITDDPIGRPLNRGTVIVVKNANHISIAGKPKVLARVRAMIRRSK